MRDVRGQYGYSADVEKSASYERYYLFQPIRIEPSDNINI